jgi:hypothetical protein
MVMMGKILVAVIAFVGIAGPCFAGGAVTYEKDIKGIVAARCNDCHGAQAPAMEEWKRDREGYTRKNLGPRMDTYEHLMVMVKGSDAGALMRRLDDGKNTKDGKPGNMYVYLGGTDTERSANLETFRKWVGSWNLKRKKDLTTEELDAIKAPEK